MATFNAKAFEKKLNTMDLSQTSIQTVSLWIIHHRQSIKEVITVWIEMMKKGSACSVLGQHSYFAGSKWKDCGKMANVLELIYTAIGRLVYVYMASLRTYACYLDIIRHAILARLREGNLLISYLLAFAPCMLSCI